MLTPSIRLNWTTWTKLISMRSMLKRLADAAHAAGVTDLRTWRVNELVDRGREKVWY